jgi:hypothetical protein
MAQVKSSLRAMTLFRGFSSETSGMWEEHVFVA